MNDRSLPTVGVTEWPVTLINVNGSDHRLLGPPDMPLLWALRDLLALTGTKFGCGIGQCGACTVHIDGQPVRSCIVPISEVDGAVTTIEAIETTSAGQRVQQAWLDLEVVQCGYCQSGQIMAAAALFARSEKPSDTEIDDAMAGNICRCCTYARIRKALRAI
jgi:isoquinoline 1-oxidoreductase subunit alpha